MNIFNCHSTSPFPVVLNEDQNHHQHLISPKPEFSSSSSSLSCPTFFYPTQDQGGVLYYREVQQLSPQQEQQEADHKYGFGGGLCDHPTLENETDSGLKSTIWKKEDKIENHETENITTSEKWKKPLKLRIVRKMVNSDQTGKSTLPFSNPMQNFENHKQPSSPSETDNSSSSNTIIRVCADCNTTKTPLWRSGPTGPKTLCNACGIRQRKARRAAAAAAANAGSVVLAAESNPSMKKKVQQKVKRSSKGCVAKYKKQCKLTATPASGSSRKNLCFEEFTINLRKKYAAFQQVFPQDEKEAAILLMALSYGLVRGN